MKSYGVTIQMKPPQQYFHMVLFIFIKYVFYKMKFAICFKFSFKALLGVKGLNQPHNR